ncbi:hypothetical protein CGQ17_23405 [Enterobacter cloacae]|nr:hypothetical protein CGQ17_23405 [Enterobacter cloacae]
MERIDNKKIKVKFENLSDRSEKIAFGIYTVKTAILYLVYIFNRQSSKDISKEWKTAQVV